MMGVAVGIQRGVLIRPLVMQGLDAANESFDGTPTLMARRGEAHEFPSDAVFLSIKLKGNFIDLCPVVGCG
jgi:hypothetical protein